MCLADNWIMGDLRMPRQRPDGGFTLVELLVVIAIIGVLLAILIPAVQAAREASRRAACQNNLHQLGIGLTNYESAKTKWPAGKKWSGSPTNPKSFEMAWSSFLLGYIEEQTLQDSINYKVKFTDPVNLPATTQTIPVYLCPSTSRFEDHRTPDGHICNLDGLPGEGLGCIDYMGISGPFKDAKQPVTKVIYGRERGVLIGTKGLPRAPELIEPPPIKSKDIVDGLSHTMCVVECTGRGIGLKHGVLDNYNGAWASGNNITHIDNGVNATKPPKCWYMERIFSEHPGGSYIVMCDASVQFLSDKTDKKVVYWLSSRDGHEDLPEDVF
jgi:prepilin-type N-terminal cleavage/methylation domain-containing protein